MDRSIEELLNGLAAQGLKEKEKLSKKSHEKNVAMVFRGLGSCSNPPIK